jgi:hypothetical protein
MHDRLRILVFGALMGAGTALAAGEVGLVNYLAGEVTYATGGQTGVPARAFMKIREGDRLSVAAGAQVRVVYFQGGLQETYAGPASFTVAAHGSVVHSGAQPRLSALPSGVPEKISQAPELFRIAKLGAAARGAARAQRLTPQQQAEVRQARETYDELRKFAPADDITAELYLYSVLQDNLLYHDMRPVVLEMQRRQPGNPDVAVMAQYVKTKTEAR